MIRSPLHERHLESGARMLPFAGWEMPIQYTGIVAEHTAVRESAGVFDISHMGELRVSGEGAGAALNRILTNDVSELGDGRGHYTLMLNEEAGVIDDLLLYRRAPDDFFLVVNASRIEEDFAWLQSRLEAPVQVEDESGCYGALAIQGPDSAELWSRLGEETSLPSRNGMLETGEGVILCRTGYTGEDGFELFAPPGEIGDWWDRIREAGAVPCGLGARDTLRLEKCYPLNGSDLDSNHSPLEAGLGFFVKTGKECDFPGKSVLEQQKRNGVPTRLAAIAMTGKSPPPRHGYEVRDGEGEDILGVLTSGSLSPSLGKGIAMAYLPADRSLPGSAVSIVIRERVFPAEVVKKPFL